MHNHTHPTHTRAHARMATQGTLTHMAPEVMLAGRVSKAADICE
jgi:hypothetical protein